MNVKLLLKTVRNTLAKNSPTILMGLGMAGGVSTVIMAINATPKALQLIDCEEKARLDGLHDPDIAAVKLTKLEIVRHTWKCYLPAAVMGALSIACFVGANSINSRRRAVLASAYALSETALKEYQSKVIETIGEKKAQQIKSDIAQDKVNANPINESTVIMTGNGKHLVYDAMSARYFRSDIETIKKTINELNKRLLEEMWINMNDFYEEIGLDRAGFGSDMGWAVNTGLIDPRFDSTLTSEGEPCLVLDFCTRPTYEYR